MMKTAKMTAKDSVLLVFLALLIIGVVYYMAFYTPLQNEIISVNNQTSQLELDLTVIEKKLDSMDRMQAELDEIFSRDPDEITEIAPYDNAKAVMNFLNGVLAASSEYDLSFSDPDIEESGTVRRNVALSFSCEDYATAKSILKNLASWNYRCLLGSIAVSAEGNGDDDENGVAWNPLKIEVTMTFFESTNLK